MMMQYETLLKSIAYNFTKSEVDAEDLLQETYLKALKYKDKYEEGTNLKAWLIAIMRNTFINKYRKQKRALNNICKVEKITDSMLNKNYHIKSPSITIAVSELLLKVFQNLSPELKEIFIKYYEGYKYQEIADEYNVPLGTVKSKIFFARKELTTMLLSHGITNSNIYA